MTNEQIKEINRLHAVVDAFASDMKTRFTQKVEAGYTGWDGSYRSDVLCGEIASDAAYIGLCIVHDVNTQKKRIIDIANRAMILWYRRKDKVK